MNRSAFILTIVCSATGGCVRHINPYNEKVRVYEAGEYAEPAAGQTEGSLWSAGSRNLFEDARARRVGDILTIRIDERSDANRDATTSTGSASQTDVGVSSFMGALAALQRLAPGVDPAKLIGAASSREFKGEGSTTRSGVLRATLPVRIKKRLPNGDYYVEGNKVLLLNDEESYLYLSGVARPVDIRPDNSIASSMLADVEVEYTGRGAVSQSQSSGWFSRALDFVWPL